MKQKKSIRLPAMNIREVNQMKHKIVAFNFPKKTLEVGSWERVSVVIKPRSGVRFDDLDFIVPKGAPAGIVSTSHDGTFDPTKPTIMLCAGYMPGKYNLLAVHKTSAL